MLILLIGCAGEQDETAGKPVDTGESAAPVDSAETQDTGDTADTEHTGDTTETGDTALVADYLFDGSTLPVPLYGFGAEVWPGDLRAFDALDPLGARLVRVPLNANLGSATLPVDQTPAQWDTWLREHGLELAPTFFDDLHTTLGTTDARSIDWIAHFWEAPPAWEDGGGVLQAAYVDDHAALIAAQVAWLAEEGIVPRWLELTNEPDGNWNTYSTPEDYDTLVVAVRADLDARGLAGVGIVGPGLAVLGGWSEPADYVPTLSDAAVDALAAWSVHTWDDYAEAGEGHLFLQARWDIFLSQTSARDADKPILVTEMGSKDTTFDGASYASPDPDTCGYATESDGYAIRNLAHLAVALGAGVDGVVWWEAADQTWECSRWGLVDVDGRPRRVHEALAAVLAGLPDDAGVVLPAAADLPAVALLGADAGVILVVNDTAERVTRTVAVAGGWSLSSAWGFGTDERVLWDELIDVTQASAVDTTLAIDGGNASLLGYDGARLYRTAGGDAAITWTPGGELISAVVSSWSWSGQDPVPVRVESSPDGAVWTVEAGTEVLTLGNWNEHELGLTITPGARSLRVVLPAEGAPAWNPQLGGVALRWRRDDAAVLPAGEAPWTVDLPPESAVVIKLGR